MRQVQRLPKGPDSTSVGVDPAPRAARPSLPFWAGPLFVTLALYLVGGLGMLHSYGFNPTGPVRFGANFDGSRYWDEQTLVAPGDGYDGQFFYYLALDPLPRPEALGTLFDRPAYRYGRILYPALVWLVALGQPAAVAWALLLVNLAAILVGTLATMDVLRSLSGSRWLALGFAFNPAVVLGFAADLAEPLCLALVAVGLALHLRGRHALAGLGLGLAALAREPTAIVALGFGLYALSQRQWRQALSYTAPLALPVAWHALVWSRLGAWPAEQSPSNFGPPLSGALYQVLVSLRQQAPLPGIAEPTAPWLELPVILLSVGIIIWGLLIPPRRRDVLAWQLWLQAALGLFTAPAVWVGLGSYARVLGLLYLFAGLVSSTGCSAIRSSRAASGRHHSLLGGPAGRGRAG